MCGLGARHNSLVSDSSSASPRDNLKLVRYWRASEASETLSGVYKFELMWYVYIYNVYVIARVGVKFGINFTSVRLSGNKIARGEAECYLPLNLTRMKFVPEISRLTVLLKINAIASLLFI